MFRKLSSFHKRLSRNHNGDRAESGWKNVQYVILIYGLILIKCSSSIQVETVGDKYMAVSGLPEPNESHARWMAKLSLEMMEIAVELRAEGLPVTVSTFDDKSNMTSLRKLSVEVLLKGWQYGLPLVRNAQSTNVQFT